MNTRRFAALLMLSFLSSLAGCLHLPEVTAKTIRYESAYPGGGTSIVVRDIEVTDTEVKAGEYTRTTKIMGVSQTVVIEGYRRERSPDRKPETLAP